MGMRIFLFAGFLILSFLILNTCDSVEPSNNNYNNITISRFDVSVSEAYLSVIINNATTRHIELLQDNNLNLSFDLAGNDTILHVLDLEAETSYTFNAILKSGEVTVGKSKPLNFTTLTATNQNFTWEVFTFGNPNYGYSTIRDVSIIDENDIWVVGEVYQLDSLGQNDPQVYGAGHWDGNQWTLMKVPYRDYGNPRPSASPGPLFSIFNILDKIFVTSYANVLEYLNESWVEKAFFIEDLNFNGQVLQMWVSDAENIYCVGRNGAIYHVTNSSWSKISSGTETTLSDVWGCIDPITGKEIKYVTGIHLEVGDEFKLLRIGENDLVEDLNWEEFANPATIWSNNSFPLFVGGSYFYTNKDGNWKRIEELSDKSTTCVRGTALNDIFVCGTFGLMAHYNGIDWKRFDNIAPGAIFSSVAIKDNIVCIVGEIGVNAIIVLGKRIN